MYAPQRVVLPDGLTVWAHNAVEAKIVFREIVAEKTYERNGIKLREGATVFDVGANIGLFAIHLTRTVPKVQVYAFELIPDVFDALRRNLEEHAPETKAYNIGLAERDAEVSVLFDRFSTITSTMTPEIFTQGASKTASVNTWAVGGLNDLEKVTGDAAWIRAARKGLASPVLRPFTLLGLGIGMLGLHFRKLIFRRSRRCTLKTLSQALLDANVNHVDLVKIDVEGAEESVISGIQEKDWPRLHQFVIEVHDVNGRLDRMCDLLGKRGFTVTRAREDWALHELLSIWTVYAVRP
jgi:hypothetical protein